MQKPNLVLLHGALGSREQFSPLLSLLEDNFTCHSFDFYGHGSESANSKAFVIEEFAHQLEQYLIHHQLSNVYCFGFSMGGYVAYTLALKNPGYFKKIFSVGTRFDWNEARVNKELKYLNPEIILSKVPHFAKELERRHGAQWMQVIARTAQMMVNLAKKPLLNQLTLPALDLPIRLSVGDRDETTSIEETLAAFKSIEEAEMEVFPRTAHPIEKMNPEFLAAKIKEALK